MSELENRAGQLIEEKRQSLTNLNQLLSAYNMDQSKTEEYNGRQLLELIQNAVDANAEQIHLRLGEEWLEIWDSGDPFTVDGIQSLLYPGRSTKHSGSYIGNKGLGFRSILNWAEEIVVQTEAGYVRFARALAKAFFEEMIPSQQDRKRLLEENGYSADVIPVPVLGVPEILASLPSGMQPRTSGKSIWIKYFAEFKEDILGQMDEVDDRTMLFLDSLKEIILDKGGDVVVTHSRKPVSETRGTVEIDGKKWDVRRSEGVLPDEFRDPKKKGQQRYSVAVALCTSDNARNQPGYLYNYFKTRVYVPLPCTIHATMELNDSRDHLKPNYRSNEFIVDQIRELLVSRARQLAWTDIDRWMPFRLLTPVGDDSVPCLGMSGDLKKSREQLPILPTVKGDYIVWNEARVLDNESADFWENNGIEIPRLLLRVSEELSYAVPKTKYELDRLIEELNGIQPSPDPDLLACIIREIWRLYPRNDGSGRKANLLLGGNGSLIVGKTAYTPPSEGGQAIEKPDSIEIVQQGQYQKLIELFSHEVAGASDRHQALCTELSFFLDILPYDSASINEKIITETNERIRDLTIIEDQKKRCVREMVRKLFHNYSISFKKKVRYYGKVCLLNQKEDLKSAEELLFGPENGVQMPYDADEYLLPIGQWNVGQSNADPKAFFRWLGVNDYVKVERIEGEGKGDYSEFFTKENIQYYNPDRIKRFTIFRLKDFPPKAVKDCSSFVNLLAHSPIVLEALRLLKSDENSKHEDVAWVDYYSALRPIVPVRPYILWQMDRWVDGNPFRGRLISEVLGKQDIPKDWIPVLEALGAHEGFDDMEPEELYAYLERIGKLPKAPEGIQQIYVRVLDALDKKDGYPHDRDFKLFVRTKSESLPRSQVYYSDNNIIPRLLRDEFPMLCLPSRRGVEKVFKRFGVNRLNQSIQDVEEDERSDADAFENHLKSLHVYLLACRLFSSEPIVSDEKTQMKEAGALREARIRLVKGLKYSVAQKKDILLEDYAYIHTEKNYYLKVPEGIGWEQLLRHPVFCDAVADIYASIFDVGGMTDLFRSILRNGDRGDLEHQFARLDDTQKDRINTLLGVGAKESFWSHFPGLQVDDADVNYLDLSQPAGIALLGRIARMGYRESVVNLYRSALTKWGEMALLREKDRYEKSFRFKKWKALEQGDSEEKKLFEKVCIKFRSVTLNDLSPNGEVFFTEEELERSLKEYCQKEWGVDIEKDYRESVRRCDEYLPYEEYFASINLDERGLFYFHGFKDEIERIVDGIRQNDKKELEAIDTNDTGKLEYIVQVDDPSRIYDPLAGKSGGYRHDTRRDHMNKKKGEAAQKKVIDLLHKWGYEAEDISGTSLEAASGDFYHADVRYRKSREDSYRYLEVKYSANDYFFMSAAERKTAESETYKHIYDLAIYDGHDVRIIPKVHRFLDKGLVPSASEYIVFFGNLSAKSGSDAAE